jgi:isoleucyl-tRNA synthetase
VAAADAANLAVQLRTNGSAELAVAGELVQVEPDDVVFTETPREGWAVQHLGGESIALDLTLTPALRRVGIARDVVRLVQEARKSSGLAVTDRIQLEWAAEGEPAAAITEHQAFIADEVLAVSVSQEPALLASLAGSAAGDRPDHQVDAELGLAFRVQLAQVAGA